MLTKLAIYPEENITYPYSPFLNHIPSIALCKNFKKYLNENNLIYTYRDLSDESKFYTMSTFLDYLNNNPCTINFTHIYIIS